MGVGIAGQSRAVLGPAATTASPTTEMHVGVSCGASVKPVRRMRTATKNVPAAKTPIGAGGSASGDPAGGGPAGGGPAGGVSAAAGNSGGPFVVAAVEGAPEVVTAGGSGAVRNASVVKYHGVHFARAKNRYFAQITTPDGRQQYLGAFLSGGDPGNAYDKALAEALKINPAR